MLIFSDLHGRLAALDRFLELAGDESLACCGDVLGPTEHNPACIERLRDVPTVLGNHEVDLLEHYRARLGEHELAWIASLPLLHRLDPETLLIHCQVESTGLGPWFCRIEYPENAEDFFEQHGERVAFTGHTHLPGYWSLPQSGSPRWIPINRPQRVELDPDCRYIINVGSLGEPKTRENPRFVRWDGRVVEWLSLD